MTSVGLFLCLAGLAAGSVAHNGAIAVTAPQDVLRADIDASVKPGVDFFEYANGRWLKSHPIPSTESSWGVGNVVQEELRARLLAINKRPADGAKPGSDEQKVHDFWTTAMDETKAEQIGLSPLQPELDRIAAIGSVQDLLDVAFELQRLGVDSLFEFDVSQDEKNSSAMAVHINQGGLGLPERDFYFNKEAGVAKIRTEYVKHMGVLLKMAGETADAATTASANVMEFETALAQTSRKLEDLRDPLANYNKMTPDGITGKLTPSINWPSRLKAWKLNASTMIVGQPAFFSGLEALLHKTSIETLREYLRVHLIGRYASYLNKEADAEDFRFNHQVLSGQKTPRPRWKRVIDTENGAIGFILGRIFVKEYFPATAKKRYSDLVEAFRQAYSRRRGIHFTQQGTNFEQFCTLLG